MRRDLKCSRRQRGFSILEILIGILVILAIVGILGRGKFKMLAPSTATTASPEAAADQIERLIAESNSLCATVALTARELKQKPRRRPAAQFPGVMRDCFNGSQSACTTAVYETGMQCFEKLADPSSAGGARSAAYKTCHLQALAAWSKTQGAAKCAATLTREVTPKSAFFASPTKG